jgi:hypothetical protein
MQKADEEKTTVGFSGDITAQGTGTAMRKWITDNPQQFHASQTSLATSAVGTMYLDVRLPAGIKGFGAMEASYFPDSGATFELSELFLDANYKKKIYVRIGKQVLQWGRCYFFNPTDLVNIEKKSFLNKLGAREGAFGAKVHIPFGTRFNLYGFLDTKNAAQPDLMAGAAKAEALIGGTEFALGVWNRRKAVPVYSFDISTTLFDFQIAGEMALSYGDNLKRFQNAGEIILNIPGLGLDTFQIIDTCSAPEKFYPRASIGITKFLDVLEVQDRLMLVAEFYYNHGGYEKSIFSDSTTCYYAGGPLEIPGVGATPIGPKAAFLVRKNLYEMNNYSKYYASIFTSLSRFIVQDMTLTLNALSNISEKSFIVSTGLSYKTLHNFSLGLNVNGFIGPTYSEYTFMNNALSVQMTAGIAF